MVERDDEYRRWRCHGGELQVCRGCQGTALEILRNHLRGDIPIHGLMIWRDPLDGWLCRPSQAEVLDETRMQSFAESNDGVDLLCVKSNGEGLRVHSQIVIAADGGASRMVKQIDPPLTARSNWYVALQKTYACKCHLEPGFFHFFAFREIFYILPHMSKTTRW
jgi:2-polyprenyl-6-methoxyphenol hydroxylase-like FAD-dependent oxidoreductase